MLRGVTPAAVWAFRASAEVASSAMFAHLARGLEAVQAHPETVRLANLAIHEELRHHRRCLELVEHYGGAPIPVTPARRTGSVPTRESVLSEVVGMCCINETVSAAALGEMLRNVRDPRVHGVVSEILRDEIQHARIGWSHLAFEQQRGEVAGLASRLQELVDAAVGDLDQEPDAPITDELKSAGALSRATRIALLHDTFEQVVIPGLERCGVPTGALRLPGSRS